MGHSPAVIVALVVALASAGCATTQRLVGRETLRPPGEKLETLPEQVASEYQCAAAKRKTFFKLEQTEVKPERVAAGAAVSHRIVYALCAPRPTDVVRGTLETRIVQGNRILARDRDPAWELKPGRWIVDATVEIPSAAQSGLYAIQVVFQSRAVKFRDERSFAVEASDPPRSASR
jgi:hypothetical protein